MISKAAGTILKKNTKTKDWWLKLAVALILSNVFFFLLFSEEAPQEISPVATAGWVEVQLRADLMTPFQKGKKILLVHRSGGQRIEGMLKNAIDLEGRLTILVKENEAAPLFLKQSWEILPYIANLKIPPLKGEMHEIRY